MCVEITIANNHISVRTEFDSLGRILIQKESNSLMSDEVKRKVYWDGWIRKEDAYKWTNKSWRRAEIFASEFNQRGRQYDVPPGQIIKGIAFNTNEKTILKILTRKALGKEADVQERFAFTGPTLLIPA